MQAPPAAWAAATVHAVRAGAAELAAARLHLRAMPVTTPHAGLCCAGRRGRSTSAAADSSGCRRRQLQDEPASGGA